MKNRALATTLAAAARALWARGAHAQPDAPPAGGAPAVPPETPPANTTTMTTSSEPAPPADMPSPPPPPAKEDAKSLAPAITGFIDGTYNYNFNHPANGLTPLHSYDVHHNTFQLDTAHVELNGSDDKLAYSVQVDAGTDAIVDSGISYFDIQEAFLTYTASSGLGFKAGKFVTFEGIEVIESGSNPTVSRGFLFGLVEPFTHVGALITYKGAGSAFDFAIGAVNGWDQIVDVNSMKTIAAKVGYTSNSLLFTLSGYAGPELPGDNSDYRFSVDGTGDYKMSNGDLWFQLNWGMEQGGAASASWFGAGVQPVFKIDDKTSIGARVELLDDLDGNRTGLKQMVVNVSAAPAYKLTDHLTMRAELRADVSTGRDSGIDSPFVDHNGDASGVQIIAMTEAIVSF